MSPVESLTIVLPLLFLAGLFIALAHWAEKGNLERNSLIGIRTPATLQSDAAWEAGHRAAAPALRTWGWVEFIGAILVLVSALLAPGSQIPVGIGLAFLFLPTLALVFTVTTKVSLAADQAHQAWEAQEK